MNARAAIDICVPMTESTRAPLVQHGMRALLVVVTALAACGGGKKSPTAPGDGSGSGSAVDPGVVAQTQVGWGRSNPVNGKISVFVEVSDHTGATKSYPVGTVVNPCQVIAATGEDAVTALRCVADNTGTEFRVVYRGELIVLRRAVDPSDDPADVELLFQEVQRIDVPVGTKVTAAPGD